LPAPCAVRKSGAPASEGSGETIVTCRVHEAFLCAVKTFETFLPRGSANASVFHSLQLPSWIQFRSNSRARCPPTHAVRCFCALPRREAHIGMHIGVCTASCRARRSEPRGAAAISARNRSPKMHVVEMPWSPIVSSPAKNFFRSVSRVTGFY
jgi:hypothetical protein